MEQITKATPFARCEIADDIGIWQRAGISLLDIRHNLMSAGDAVQAYRMPASAFIYTSGSNTEVLLNDTSYHMQRFGLFHAGKGTELSIRPTNGWLEYYMLLYKPSEPTLHKREYAKMLMRSNPFQRQYGFAPDNPLFFSSQLRLLYEKWKGPTPLNLFYGKAAFYQLVYQVYEELDHGQIQVLEPDLIAVAMRYLDRHYSDAITIQEVCSMLGISYSHFHRRFTKQVGKNPQDYLISARLAAAMQSLQNSDASIREVATYCGFADEYNFHRLFLKNVGVTPGAYREKSSAHMRDYIIGSTLSFPYNEQGEVSLGKSKEKGANPMFKVMRGKAVVAAALSLMLLMSACSAAPVNTGAPESTPTPAVTEQGTQQPKTTQLAEGETRTISTVMGDVKVPANPKRVVVDYLMGDIVALGIVPAGVSKESYAGLSTAFADGIKDSANVGEWDLELESVMAVEPDVIILAFSQDPYEDLSKIAPTIVVPYGDMSTQERLTFLGEVLNREEEAKTAIAAYEDKLLEGKQRLKDAGLLDATVTIAQAGGDGAYIAGSKHATGALVYNELGLSAPQRIQTEIIDADEYWGVISMEVLEAYCGGFIITLGEVGPALQDNAVWNLIPAVKNEHVFGVETVITWYTDVMSMTALVDLVVDGMINAAAQQQ